MNIKDYREKELKWYFVVVGLIYLAISSPGGSVFSYFDHPFTMITNTFHISALSSVVYFTDSVFDRKWKEKIATFMFFSRMPGEVVFSKLIMSGKDERFAVEEALNKYSEIYRNIAAAGKEKYLLENSSWYKIYQKHKDDPMVWNSNRDYLLRRDMCVSTVSMSAIYFVLCFLGIFSLRKPVLFMFLVLYAATVIATHIKAKRFCLNVIALDISG